MNNKKINKNIIYSILITLILTFTTAVNSLSDNLSSFDVEILLNERVAIIHPDGTMETLTHRIIKVNTYQGIERYKKLDITYNKDYDEIVVSKVQSLTENTEAQGDVMRDFSPVASSQSTNNSTSAVTPTNPVNPVKNTLHPTPSTINYQPSTIDHLQNTETVGNQQLAVGSQQLSNYQITKLPNHHQPSANLYLNTKTITMPIEKPGDIFEYEIIVKRFKPLIKNHFWNVHIFNDVMPIKKSIFTVFVPNVGAGLGVPMQNIGRALYYKAYNMQLEPTVEEYTAESQRTQRKSPLERGRGVSLTKAHGEKSFKTYTWEMSNIPAISVTEGLNPTSDVLSRVVISSTNTWDDIIEWFNTIYEDKIIPDEKIKQKVQELISASDPQKNVVRVFRPAASPQSNSAPSAPLRENSPIPPSAISHQPSAIRPLFDYVAYSMPFLGNELGKGAFIPRPAPDVLIAHQGDCKDKVVLLTAMLHTVGIEAYPALLNSVSDIPIEDQLPTPYYFNHAIVYVPAQKSPAIHLTHALWLDPTSSAGRWDFVPIEDRGKTALVLIGKESKFIRIKN